MNCNKIFGIKWKILDKVNKTIYNKYTKNDRDINWSGSNNLMSSKEVCLRLTDNQKSEVLVGRMCLKLAGNRKTRQCGENCFNTEVLAILFLFYKKDVDNLQIENIIKIVVNVAQKYKERLENKNILFIYLNRSDQKIRYIETKFLSKNFLHLTGLNFLNKYSNYFYKLCLNNKLKSKDLKIENQKIFQMKLEILNNLVLFDKKTKMLGFFNNSKLKLNTEIIIGNVDWCLGFINENGYYIPNTLFKEDIRNVVTDFNRVICIMSKRIKEESYINIDYLVKDFKMKDIINSEGLKNKISIKVDKNYPNRS